MNAITTPAAAPETRAHVAPVISGSIAQGALPDKSLLPGKSPGCPVIARGVT